MKKKVLSVLAGVAGAGLLFFMGWEYNSPLVPWVAFPLLVYFFRSVDRWYKTLPVAALMIAAKFLCINGGWDIGVGGMLGFAALVNVPLLAALYLDRAYRKRLGAFASTLVFPLTYLVLDYLLTFTNLGMVFSLAYTQSTFLALAQSASLLGSWFVGFLVAWFAPAAVLWVENRKAPAALACFAVLMAALCFGSARLALDHPDSPAVRVGSVTVAHDQDYWAITDLGTPREEAEAKKPAMAAVRQELFRLSRKAAEGGAKIIFWSEGNAPMYEDDYPAFLEQAKAFARENQVYFMPAVVEMLYGQAKNRNLAIMIDSAGEVRFTYEKTYSWYPSDSDGRVPFVDTPYGRISAVICFDMDYPAFVAQAKDSDIMLVPAFDTKKVGYYHTRAAFLRGIENGFSVVRQDNEGASISADFLGNTLTYQDYFRTEERVMISDVPTKGEGTLYGATGEIFLWLVFVGFAAVNILFFISRRKQAKK